MAHRWVISGLVSVVVRKGGVLVPHDVRDILRILAARLPEAAVADLVAIAEAMIRLDEQEAALRAPPSPPTPTTRAAPPGASQQ
jgi:hypothetical protein